VPGLRFPISRLTEPMEKPMKIPASAIPAPSEKIKALGIAWYQPQDYPAILKVMADADNLPRTFQEWYDRIHKREVELIAAGHNCVRVIIDPRTFPAWCAANGRKLDAEGSTAFAAEQAARQAGLI